MPSKEHPVKSENDNSDPTFPEDEDKEPSDDELLREIAEEEARLEQARLAEESRHAESIKNFDPNNPTKDLPKSSGKDEGKTQNAGSKTEVPPQQNATSQEPPLAQLTKFQEGIITTGSGVSMILLILLAVLFVIQAIRKVWHICRSEQAKSNVQTPLDISEGVSAEDMNPFDASNELVYASYDFDYPERDEFIREAQQEKPDRKKLKKLLLQRAIKCIQRISIVQRDAPGIQKNFQTDMIPQEVYDEFQMANATLNQEFEEISQHNEMGQFVWPRHGNNIFEAAKEECEKEMAAKQRLQELEQLRLQRQQGRQLPAANTSGSAPRGSNFGKGLKGGFFNKKKKKNRGGDDDDGPVSAAPMVGGARRRKGKRRMGKK